MRPRRAARSGSRRLSQPRHLHVLRHREQQSDADGSHGSASAEFGFRASAYAVARRVLDLTVERGNYTPIGHVVDEKAIVNGIVALLATGGSTNHTLHLVAIARAAGIVIDWDDFDNLSQSVPLLAKIYPNGKADVNHFHAAGGVAFLVRNL